MWLRSKGGAGSECLCRILEKYKKSTKKIQKNFIKLYLLCIESYCTDYDKGGG